MCWWLPRHPPLGVLTANLRCRLARRPYHNPFLNHVDHIVDVHRVQEKYLVGLAGGENLGPRSLHVVRQARQFERVAQGVGT